MPELPDIEVFTRNLHDLFAGRTVKKVEVINGKKFGDKPAALRKALTGKKLKKVYRSGKEMRFEFSGNLLLGLHLMLTGDLFVFDKVNDHHSTLVEFYFTGKNNLVLTDRMRNANIKLNPVNKKGLDALSSGMNLQFLRTALQRKKIIKTLLTDQDIIRGIGNSYSDEILWEARISPYSVASAIPDDKIKLLSKAIKKILSKEIGNIYKYQKGKVNGEVKDFLKIHTKEKTHSPTGAPIIIEKKGMMKTYYTKEQILYK